MAEFLGKISNNPSILSREKYFEMKQLAWIVNTDAVREKLGFTTQLSFQEAVQETIDWYIDNNWL